MSLRLVEYPEAAADVDSYSFRIGRQNPDAGRRFLEAVQEAYRFLADFPEAGGSVAFRGPLGNGLRQWGVPGFGNYVIYYRAHPDRIEILRVLHGARRPGPALRQAQTPPPPSNGQTGGTPGP
jgi:toxin ParE1/3/4